MFTRVHYIFCRDFPKGWLRVTLKGIWCHREHTLKSKRTLYSFISFRFVKLVLPRGHKSRRRKCFPENRRTQLQVDVFFFLFIYLSLASMYVGRSLNEALSYIIEQFNCEMSPLAQTDYLTIQKVLSHQFVKDQELGLDFRIISPTSFTVFRTSSHPCISTK